MFTVNFKRRWLFEVIQGCYWILYKITSVCLRLILYVRKTQWDDILPVPWITHQSSETIYLKDNNLEIKNVLNLQQRYSNELCQSVLHRSRLFSSSIEWIFILYLETVLYSKTLRPISCLILLHFVLQPDL